MPKSRNFQGNLSQDFHDVMLAVTTGSARSGPSISQGASPPRRDPSISQGAPPPQRPVPNANNRSAAWPVRPAFGSSDKGASAELKEKYGILQHGFITLENKYKRRQAELTRLREELRLQAEKYTIHTNGLTEQLESKEKRLEELHGELKDIVQATRAVKSIIDQTLAEFSAQLMCPICSKLLQVPHSLDCLHTACCACIITSFQHHGIKCPVCLQPCTQLPKQSVVITGMLSITYKLHKVEEPTFASLGLDPALFVKFFQSFERPPDNPQGDAQHQLVVVQSVGSTHGQDQQNVGTGDGAVSDHIGLPIHHGEGGEGNGTVGVAAQDDINMDVVNG